MWLFLLYKSIQLSYLLTLSKHEIFDCLTGDYCECFLFHACAARSLEVFNSGS